MSNDNKNSEKKYQYSLPQLIGIVGVTAIVSMGISYTLMLNKAKSKKANAKQSSIERVITGQASAVKNAKVLITTRIIIAKIENIKITGANHGK